jgi:hypothetical protein
MRYDRRFGCGRSLFRARGFRCRKEANGLICAGRAAVCVQKSNSHRESLILRRPLETAVAGNPRYASRRRLDRRPNDLRQAGVQPPINQKLGTGPTVHVLGEHTGCLN